MSVFTPENLQKAIERNIYFSQAANEYGLPAVQRLKGWEFCSRRYPNWGPKCQCGAHIDTKDHGDALFEE